METYPAIAKNVVLYTLCLEGTALAVCALESAALKRDEQGTICDAFLEAWMFGGGDPMQLAGRAMVARPPSNDERAVWFATVEVTHKPIVILGGEAMGAA